MDIMLWTIDCKPYTNIFKKILIRTFKKVIKKEEVNIQYKKLNNVILFFAYYYF